MWKCMESMVGVYGIHVEFMEQNHSIWIPPGMWGHSKVLKKPLHLVFERQRGAGLQLKISKRK